MTSLTFGKYKGVPASEIPSGYLKWLTEQGSIDNATRQAVQAELDQRALNRVSLNGQYRRCKPNATAERRLLAAGWIKSDLGYWSKWWSASSSRPGWACYQISAALALAVQTYLDEVRQRRAA
jgi:hypothetical protein